MLHIMEKNGEIKQRKTHHLTKFPRKILMDFPVDPPKLIVCHWHLSKCMPNVFGL